MQLDQRTIDLGHVVSIPVKKAANNVSIKIYIKWIPEALKQLIYIKFTLQIVHSINQANKPKK